MTTYDYHIIRAHQRGLAWGFVVGSLFTLAVCSAAVFFTSPVRFEIRRVRDDCGNPLCVCLPCDCAETKGLCRCAGPVKKRIEVEKQ
jgi:hypothetical protein